MDKRQKELLKKFFKGNVKRIYLPPPTSQKNVPKGMAELDKWLAERAKTNN